VESLRQLRAKAQQRAAGLIPAIFYELFGHPNENLGNLPKVKLGEITSLVTSGLTPKGGARIYTTTGPIFIRSQNVLMNSLDFTDAARLPQKIHEGMSRTKVKEGDVLLNITGASIGRVAWVENLFEEANVNQHVCIIRLKDGSAIPEYVSVVLSTPYGQNQINSMQTGASRQGLNHQQVRKIEIPLPSLEVQHVFANRIAEVHNIISYQEQCTAKIDDFQNAFLARSFKGVS
jgi:type I restriction enzyme, S subunit